MAVPDIDILLERSHLYKITINEMLEDVDLLCELTGKETGRSGIAYFVPEQNVIIISNGQMKYKEANG